MFKHLIFLLLPISVLAQSIECDSHEFTDSLSVGYYLFPVEVFHSELDSIGLEVLGRKIDVEDVGMAPNEKVSSNKIRTLQRKKGRVVYKCKKCGVKLYGEWRSVYNSNGIWRTSNFKARKW